MQSFAVFLAAVLATLPASAMPLEPTGISNRDLGVHEKKDIGPDADAGQIYIYD
ncbi:hypothetical protein INS49_004820 [Diaporthe citri]|uniref:uncharacterized protein n=1 Tax=Diaporthe citri TaxID=83186 RepID=UPI001C7ED8B5|nr:uncharacterized protein INS49_004820 [Diaporthe citri]KAG6354216.1 hypothetical protein INS49_004820 [Diaporthe citri]